MVHTWIKEAGSVNLSRSNLCRGTFQAIHIGGRNYGGLLLHTTLSTSEYGPGEVFAIPLSITLGKVLMFSCGA